MIYYEILIDLNILIAYSNFSLVDLKNVFDIIIPIGLSNEKLVNRAILLFNYASLKDEDTYCK